MKNSFFASALAIITVIGFSSYSKKTTDAMLAPTTIAMNPSMLTPPATPTTTAGFRAKIDGAVYTPDFTYAKASLPRADGSYTVYGLDSKTSDVVVLTFHSSYGR